MGRLVMNARIPVLGLVAATALAACGGSTPTTTSGGPSKVASIASQVPSTVTGPIQIATDATYAPNEFVDPNTGAISGWDIDLGTVIAGDKNNCKDAGKQDIKVLSFQTQTDANSALLSGRADFGWLDQPVADYQVKQSNGKFKIGGQPCSVAPYG